MSWQATAEWWAGIEVARKCQRGFIGHLGSSATIAMLEALCFHHYLHYLHCPLTFTFDHNF
jgi:hypothetical protein